MIPVNWSSCWNVEHNLCTIVTHKWEMFDISLVTKLSSSIVMLQWIKALEFVTIVFSKQILIQLFPSSLLQWNSAHYLLLIFAKNCDIWRKNKTLSTFSLLLIGLSLLQYNIIRICFVVCVKLVFIILFYLHTLDLG